jgi:hypothetical protein
MRTLEHGMLLSAKNVIDNALPELAQLKELIPEMLHGEFDKIIAMFEETLCFADVSDEYEEKK